MQFRSHRQQAGVTSVDLMLGLAAVAVIVAAVMFTVSGVSANTACNNMKSDGATIQSAASLYFDTYGVYPVGTATPSSLPGAGDALDPAGAATVNQQELLMANLLQSATAEWNASPQPAGAETFTYKGVPQGAVHGALVGNESCQFH